MGKAGPEFNGVPPVVDLRKETAGITCEEYTLLTIAGPYYRNLPPEIRNRMDQHIEACEYHNSNGFIQSALGAPVTPELERAALGIIEKYTDNSSSK